MKDKSTINYTLYLVTDKKISKNRDTEYCVEQAILGGSTIIQLREKDLSTFDFYNIALKVKAVTDKYNIPLIVNDRLDIALAIDADGLHIGQDDMPLLVARKLLGPDKIIGVSVATIDEALKAQMEGADYIGVGAVFSTSSKDDARSVSLQTLSDIKSLTNIPVVAIGGINNENIGKVVSAGVDGSAVISAILSKEDIQASTKVLCELISGFKNCHL